MRDEKFKPPAWSRWAFLQTMGASVPTLSLMGAVPSGGAAGADVLRVVDKSRFTPLDLQP